MPRSKIAISLDADALARVDRLVEGGLYPNRSRAIEAAVRDALARLDRTRLARECAKLDSRAEATLADEGLAGDVSEWPAY
ncbi:MAG TPA: ribbon-helix-helix domain-containing protein [Gemmatimonadales bacterium]|jgi:Arc/MetJ-type ribon-helix-helix transcriptional regulator